MTNKIYTFRDSHGYTVCEVELTDDGLANLTGPTVCKIGIERGEAFTIAREIKMRYSDERFV